jgi:SAM-dependent methyltransferase
VAQEWFENWFDSKYYPILYNNRDYAEAAAFVEHLASYLQLNANDAVVDIACGEGRFAAVLATKAHTVIGVDLSEQRILEAKKLEQDRLHFYVHDMRYPFYVNYFDYAFNFFTSFGYFATPRDNHMAAAAFATSLKKGGKLIVDYLNQDVVLQHLVPQQQMVKQGITFDITKRLVNTKIVKDIRVTDTDGSIHHFQESVSAFNLEDFIILFEAAGLKMIEHFGNYQLQPFHKTTSPRLIMIFEKL